MHEVAIVGAGELGGALAYALARRDVVSKIRLIDDRSSLAVGKALDITQAAPIELFATAVAGGADLYAAASADLIVIADRAEGGEWDGEDGLLLLRRLAQMQNRPVIACAGARQRELVERGVRELRIARTSLFGTAPEALAAAIRALVALDANGSPGDVGLTVFGVPPDHIIVPWEEVTVGGIGVMRLLDEPTRRRLAARLGSLWPPGPQALAAAAAKAIEGIVGRSRRLMSCFVAPDDSAGVRARAVALPARLGPAGIAALAIPTLNVHDRVALDNAMML